MGEASSGLFYLLMPRPRVRYSTPGTTDHSQLLTPGPAAAGAGNMSRSMLLRARRPRGPRERIGGHEERGGIRDPYQRSDFHIYSYSGYSIQVLMPQVANLRTHNFKSEYVRTYQAWHVCTYVY